MVYSKDFKKKARELYPNKPALHEALEDGMDNVVNNILYLALSERFRPETVLQYIDTDPNKLKKDAELMVAKKALFHEWLELFESN